MIGLSGLVYDYLSVASVTLKKIPPDNDQFSNIKLVKPVCLRRGLWVLKPNESGMIDFSAIITPFKKMCAQQQKDSTETSNQEITFSLEDREKVEWCEPW